MAPFDFGKPHGDLDGGASWRAANLILKKMKSLDARSKSIFMQSATSVLQALFGDQKQVAQITCWKPVHNSHVMMAGLFQAQNWQSLQFCNKCPGSLFLDQKQVAQVTC